MNTKYPIEAYTTAFDYLKHISSLCTGSILLIMAFLEKLFKNPEWKFCIAISIVSFLISVIASVAAQASVIEQIDHPDRVGKWSLPLMNWSFIGVWFFFLLGLISLTIFALVNLY